MNTDILGTINNLTNMISPEVSDLLLNVINTPTNPSNHKIPTSITHSPTRVVVYAEMPGFDRKSIDIDFYNNRMTIKGHKPSPTLMSDEKVLVSNIKYGHFTENINLPVSVTNRRNVTTNYQNGFLEVLVDLSMEEQNRFTLNLD